MAGQTVTRAKLAELLNEDLAREYQAIIAYVVYSQVLTGAEYMSIAALCAHSLAADRLSRQDADRDPETGQGLEESARHAALRSAK